MGAAGAGGASSGGSLYTWGNNGAGELGLGDIVRRSAPVQVGDLTTWASINTGSPAFGITTSGALFSWGNGYWGNLGHGDNVNRSSPVQVGSLTDWAFCRSDSMGAAVKTDGTLWTWGYATLGRQGRGDTINTSSPIQVGSLTDWATVYSDVGTTFAIKTDGTLWAWGDNEHGTLGLGDVIFRSSPVQVGSLTDWASISTLESNLTHAIKTDGTLWSWGYSYYGALGHGLDKTVSKRSSPVQVGSLTNWANVGHATVNCAFAVKTDGTLWSWGKAQYGQTARESTVNSSSPVQVGSLTNWSSVAHTNSNANSGWALKTDGTVWAWGTNLNGELGDGTKIRRSSPVQVGTGTNWIAIGAGASGIISGIRA